MGGGGGGGGHPLKKFLRFCQEHLLSANAVFSSCSLTLRHILAKFAENQ